MAVLGSRVSECYLRLMGRVSGLCGVVLAAGESSRMGRDKALLPWPPQATSGTFLSAMIQLFDPFVDVVLVVGGANQDSIAPVVYANGAALVVNPDPPRGQFSSLQVGLHEVLNRGRDAAMITLVDRPPVSPSTIQILSDAFDEALLHSQWAVVPEYGGKHGHPIFAGREMIEAFLRAPATSSAREIEHVHREKITYIPVDDPLVVVNIDTPEQYAELPSPAVSTI
jgi:molybdenum cofactor cytidylyltransferase